MIPTTWNDASNIIAQEIAQLISRKQHDYGSGNILGFGELGIVVRAWDKINRLKNLVGKEAKEESLEDSWKDLAGYAIIALMLRRGWFTLPLQEP